MRKPIASLSPAAPDTSAGPLIAQLLERGHEVQALVRPGSERKLPAGCQAIPGDALDGKSYASKITPADTLRTTGRRLASQSVEGGGVS